MKCPTCGKEVNEKELDIKTLTEIALHEQKKKEREEKIEKATKTWKRQREFWWQQYLSTEHNYELQTSILNGLLKLDDDYGKFIDNIYK